MKNVAASVKQRLLNFNRSQAQPEEFQKLLGRYALERLLYRLSLSRSIWFRLSIHVNFYIAKRVRKCDRLQNSAPLGVLQSSQQLNKWIMDLVFDDWLRQQELEAFRLANSTIATRACPTPDSTFCATASN
ncbi:MAG: hypothetical protein CLLPBCKN_007655 [Chroococcidiopsis cubana SAG 39.79]|uniref:hypothetical protein n=1 Tax=Chroococcidiopsis cubana TaxID=171392 RepID=UPI000D0559BB|nr:hypothetical protein [Chroococcidiopsis cubana]MDZ4878220.1 hypothetical protein [Chroococcidiopsis cubana SAG 39.79]PSB66591.1 hypothetical protein C7B79_00625 [Chroococcidiopsis cubana CCALA 043]